MWNGGWALDCNPYNDPFGDTVWPPRCKLPCVQYGMLDEPYFADGLPTYGTPRQLCPCGGGAMPPWSQPFNWDIPRAAVTMLALSAWWDYNVINDLTESRWTHPDWSSQGKWLGGRTLRDAMWQTDGSSSYCSWPFLECAADCETSQALTAIDLRNASLYIGQLRFDMFYDLSEAERSDIWYM